MADTNYKAVDISINAFLPESSYKHLSLGLWKASGPSYEEKIRKGWTAEYMVEMMDRGNVERSLPDLTLFGKRRGRGGADCSHRRNYSCHREISQALRRIGRYFRRSRSGEVLTIRRPTSSVR